MRIKKNLLRLTVLTAFVFTLLSVPQPVNASTSVRENQLTTLAQKEKSQTPPKETFKKLGSVVGLVVVLSGFSLLFIKKRRVNEEDEEK